MHGAILYRHHTLIQRFMPQTFTPYLLNRENFLEHIFSLSIEFLYHSVSESSKAINPYIPMKLCSFYTQVQAHSVELSVWPNL